MFTIIGATGRVGSAAAHHLFEVDVPIRVVVRDAAKGDAWTERGAEVAVADLGERTALASALRGSEGAFVLLPFDPTVTDIDATTRSQVAAIAGAVTDSAVPHVVVLSSAGADLPSGTGPIVGLHLLEEALRATGTLVTAVRSGHFQEKVGDVLDAARYQGIYPVLADSADRPMPMIATRDNGRIVADALLAPPDANEVIDVTGPHYTDRQVARLLGAALGRDLEVVTVPRSDRVDTLVSTGLPRRAAELLAELADADERGLLAHRGDRTVACTTPLETTLSALLGVPA